MKKKFLKFATASCLASIMFLMGCGSTATTKETKSSGTTSQAASTQAASSGKSDGNLVDVKFQLKYLPSVQFMGFYVAYEKGYYKDAGINLEIIPGGPDINAPGQVASGAADIGLTNTYNLLSYQEQGYPLVEISQLFQKAPFVLVSLKKTGINSVKDLKGKTIGAWLGGNDYPIYAMLDKYGLNKDTDVHIVKQGSTIDDLLNGNLDAISAMTYNELLQVYEKGHSESDVNVIDVNKEGVAMLADCIIANTDWLAKQGNDEVCAKFLEATIKGWKEACQNPEEATDIVWKLIDQSSTSKDHQIASAKKVAELISPDGFDINKIGYMDKDALKTTADISKKYGVISKDPSANWYDTKYWDMAQSGK